MYKTLPSLTGLDSRAKVWPNQTNERIHMLTIFRVVGIPSVGSSEVGNHPSSPTEETRFFSKDAIPELVRNDERRPAAIEGVGDDQQAQVPGANAGPQTEQPHRLLSLLPPPLQEWLALDWSRSR